MKMRSPRNVTVNLMGGLGNQLLQYATALNLSMACESRLILNSFLLSRTPINSSADKRELEIMQFAYSGEIQNLGKVNTFRSMILGRIAWTLAQRPILGNLWIRTPNFFLKYRNLKNKNLHITGFFTSYLYFHDILPKLRQQIEDIRFSTEWFTRQLAEFEIEEFYAMHIRRGDYENLTDHFGLLTSSYYLSAINNLVDTSGYKNIYVFSDDISKAKDLFQEFPYELKYVQQSSDSTALESLILMSKSSGLVIANSTFSWWAGILSNMDVPVLYPKPFLKNEKFETKDFFPKNWQAVDHVF